MMPDYGHEAADKGLKKLEKDLKSLYLNAAVDMQEKARDFMRDFERKDEQMRALVAEGKWTEDQYNTWRRNQMMTEKRMQDMTDQLAKDLANTDKIAAGMINNTLPSAYAENYNFGTYEIETGTTINTSFTLYDKKTVENLMKEDPKIIPQARVNIPEDERWNRQKLTSAIAQGILQGESIPKIANRLQGVAAMDRNAAIRNARTYTTAAENKGRVDSIARANEMGIPAEQEWLATLDDRTRMEHRHLDGQTRPVGEPFEADGYKIMYPGDPDAEPEMIYNCRCTLVSRVRGRIYNDERNDSKLDGMSYEEWKHAKDRQIKPEEKPKEEEKTPIEKVSKWGPAEKGGLNDDEANSLLKLAGIDQLDGTIHADIRTAREGERERVKIRDEEKEVVLVAYPKEKEVFIDEISVQTTGQGEGTKLLEEIRSQAEAQGYEKITAYAAGDINNYYNGYYSLARFGFDGEIPEKMQEEAAEKFGAKTIQDLMQTPESRAWWKENGTGFEATLELNKQETQKEEPAAIKTIGNTGMTFNEVYGDRPTVEKQIKGVSKKGDARSEWLQDTLEIDEDEAEIYLEAVDQYTKGDYTIVHNGDPKAEDTIEALDEMLHDKFMPVFDGTIYRGVHVDDSDDLTATEKLNAIISGGTWNEPGITSFSSRKDKAEQFATGADSGESGMCVLIICKDNKSGCPIQHLTDQRPEAEVLVPSDIKDRGYKIINSQIIEKTQTIERWHWDPETNKTIDDEPRIIKRQWAIIEVEENERKKND